MDLTPNISNEITVVRFADLKNNWTLFFSIISLIWLEIFLKELLDRGFLMNWIARMFSCTLLATVLAVIIEAAIFGFRDSDDLSER